MPRYASPIAVLGGVLGMLVGVAVNAQTVIINELDSDTPSTDELEFVELYDGGVGNTSLTGLVLVFYNGSNDQSYAAFDLDGRFTDANGYFVLGNAAVANVDFVFPQNTLQNGQDAVALYALNASDFPTGSELRLSPAPLDALVYDTNDADDVGLLVLLESGEPQIDENGGGDGAGHSVQRCPNGSGGARRTSTYLAAAPSPGTENACGGTEPPPATISQIYDVQGSGAASPFALGTVVTIEGIVTGDFQSTTGSAVGTHGDLDGFYVQAVPGDGNPATSDGIFVFYGSGGPLNVTPGDRVQVTGTVTEYFGETQITASTGTAVAILSSGNALPAPTPILLGGSTPTVANADGELIADLEPYEGMLVTFPQTLVVGELFNLDRFGELRLNSGDRLQTFTNTNVPSVVGYQSFLVDVAQRSLMLDDGLNNQNPNPIRYPLPGLSTANAIRMGDTATGLTGNLRFSRGSGGSGDETFRLMPTVEPTFIAGPPRPTSPALDGSLRFASFNVLNFFNTLDTGSPACFLGTGPGDCRGANSAAELTRQLDKLVSAIAAIDADVYGLTEIENDYPDGASSSIATLVDALNGAPTSCGGNYDYVVPPNVPPYGRHIGGDAIAIGFIYCASTVRIAPGTAPATLDDADVVALGFTPPVFDGINTSRVPLAVTFEELATTAKVTAVINHFKSKSASTLLDAGSVCLTNPVLDPNCDQLDGQGFWAARRESAARALTAWLATAPTGSDDPDVLILGDLNAYQKENAITLIRNAGYVSLAALYGDGANAYSYVFDGQRGLLDQALASRALGYGDQVTGIVDWHINADEADGLDYNLDFGRDPGIFDGSVPYRSSDHDPVVVGLDLFVELTGTNGRDTLNGSVHRDRITGGPGGDRITTGAGADVVVYSSVVDGGDTIVDFTVGMDRIDLAAVLSSLGYLGADPLGDGRVVVTERGGQAIVSIDPDGSGVAPARAFIQVVGVSAAALNDAANFIFF